MQPGWIRASVALEKDRNTDEFLPLLEEELARPLEPIRVLRNLGILVLRLTGRELERVRRMPGVRRAEAEGRCELPPRPGSPGIERE